MNWSLLQNSLLVAACATLLSLLLGQAVAIWMSGVSGCWRRLLLLLSVVVLVLPPFLVVNAWIDLFGATGSLHLWLPFDLYSLTGTVVLLGLMHWPIVALLTHANWRQLDPELSEIDPALRGFAFYRTLLLPNARTSIVQSAALVFVLALNQFSIPAILQVKVYPAELWIRFNTTFDHVEALLLSWPIVLFPLALIWLFARAPVRWPQGLKSWEAQGFRRQTGGLHGLAVGIAVCALALSLALPLGQLVLGPATWAHLWPAFAAGRLAIWQSVWLAGISAVLVLVLGWLSARTRWGALGWPFFFLPGVLIGILLILVFNRQATHWIYSTMAILVVGLSVRYLAPAWYGARLIRQGMDRDLADAGTMSGARGWDRWRWIDWPQVRPQMLALAYVIYLLCLWDVETINLIVPGGVETVSLRIFNLLHYGHNEQVNALCLLLLFVALLPAVVGLAVSGLVAWIRRRST